MQSLAERGIIWIEREIVQRGDCMAASLCPPIAQSRTSCNAISVGSRKDWNKYLLKHLGQVASAPSFFVVILEVVEMPVDPWSSDSGKRQVPPTIGGFAPLVLALRASLFTDSGGNRHCSYYPRVRPFYSAKACHRNL